MVIDAYVELDESKNVGEVLTEPSPTFCDENYLVLTHLTEDHIDTGNAHPINNCPEGYLMHLVMRIQQQHHTCVHKG